MFQFLQGHQFHPFGCKKTLFTCTVKFHFQIKFFVALLLSSFLVLDAYGQEDVIDLSNWGIQFVYIPGGSFEMGDIWDDGFSDDEKPVHPVTVSDFWMSQTEVTNAQFCLFLNDKGNPSEGGVTWIELEDEDCMIQKVNDRFIPKGSYWNYPVVEVTWFGAKAFAEWMDGRLPTEAEWEYAARAGGRNIKYPNGNRLTYADANISGVGDLDIWHKASPVARFQPNALGLYDMAGNVWERCSDWYGEHYYNESPTDNPQGPDSGHHRVMRGGSWNYSPMNCKTTTRGLFIVTATRDDIGFRIVRNVE